MKKTFYSAMLASVLLMAVSCAKSFEAEEGQSGVQEAAPLFTASTENDESKTTLGNDDFVYWETTDTISVNGAKYKVKEITEGNPTRAIFEIVQEEEKTPESPYQAFYPYELYDGTTATLPAEQEYQAGKLNVNPMYAESTTQSFTFKNICALLEIVVPEGKTVTKVEVSSDQYMNGSFDIEDGETIELNEDGTQQVTLNCGEEGAGAGSKLYVAIPPQAYTNLQVKLVGAKLIKKIANRTISRNKIYSVKGFVEDKPTFSVSATKKVYFSPGNLQAEVNASGTPTSWKFAEKQWNYIGNAVANTKIGSAAGTIDLFGWSTDATNNNWGIHTKTNTTSGYTNGEFEDWGQNIGDGTTWRTLSKDEWSYLLSTRTVNGGTGEGKSYQRATINSDATGVYGMIIYPDGYTKQKATSVTSYTSSDWSTMEAAGCVFLPAAGYRSGSSVKDVGSYGDYWSSTGGGANYAYGLGFVSGSVNPANYNSRFIGQSVRLVQESK